MAEDIMLAWETSLEALEMRRRFDDDEDELEDDTFGFDDEDDEEFDEDDEELEEEDLDDEDLDDFDDFGDDDEER
jgi:hypothetical protein